ncbi:hypothetical protein Sps_05573 [Shewanella psychrophila]|uniref:Uncharacterized protein n=1 Tax=Shewanella psychrophila TaxID=225848 RepID=A0A1S6HYG6_9GAMM|nr:type III secretion system needle length determinant [Shewanella psychrophila]AQS40636.1 hypothetical protein Sps_05573 [Shewanella psychrophila]
MLTPKEIVKSNDSHIAPSTSAPRKTAKESVINQFEQVMNAPLIKANSGGNVRESQQNQTGLMARNAKAMPFSPKGLVKANPEQGSTANLKHSQPRHGVKNEKLDGEAIEKDPELSSGNSTNHHETSAEGDISPENKQIHLTAESGQIPASLATSEVKPISDKLATSDKQSNLQSLSTLDASFSPLPNNKKRPVLVAKGLVSPILAQVIDPKISLREFNTPSSDTKFPPLGKQGPETLKDMEAIHIPNQASSQLNNAPGNIILANIKTSEPINQQLHTLVSQLVERIQILVPNITNQDRIQLILDKGQLKGTEITISLKNNQLTVTLIHSSQNAELLQHMRPELLDRLQRINIDQQVRVITTSHEQQAHGGQQEQGQQQESSQKSRIIHDWLEEQNDA